MADTLNVIKKSEQGLMELIEATPTALEVAPAVHGHDAAEIVSGVISLDRLPPTEGVVVASGNITTLTAPQQASIVEGTLVVLGTGEQYRYKGSGSKTDLASYVAQVMSVGWSAITGKPDLEPALGNPGAGNWVLRTNALVRSWIALGGLAFKSFITDSDVENGAGIQWGKISKSGAVASDVGALSGSGTTNTIPKWVSPSSLGDSGITDDGSTVKMFSRELGAKALGSVFAASDTIGAGSSIGLADSATSLTKEWLIQLGASNTLDFWNFAPSVWTKRAQLLADGGFRLAALAGTGTRPVAVDSTGKLVATSREVLWSDAARDFNASSSNLTMLSASSAQRKIAANTWTAGKALQLKIQAIISSAYAGSSSTQFQFFIGPDGSYISPFYMNVNTARALAAGQWSVSTVVTIRCVSPGASGVFYYTYDTTISNATGTAIHRDFGSAQTGGNLNSINTTADGFIDFTEQAVNTSIYGVMSSAEWLS